MTYTPPPIDQPITVLHEDKWLLAVSKPSGLLSVPGRGEDKQDCLESRIRAQYPGALTVHRLDMETSGLVLFARTKAAQAALGKLFETRQIDKTYIARVHGHLQGEGGTVNAAMRCDWTNRPRQMIDPNQGKEAITHWRVLAREAEATRVELKPQTGRSHQLRVHMLHLGHPIIGDTLYSNPCADIRLQLHAQSLAFTHPFTDAPFPLTDLCVF